ncbi:hypothetical protein NC651_017529 [Populus alba x Populus x berolinensis]|nr:hypothetical protein NC651_017529 [Populus alba x Populus x berolinensis]
MGHDNHMTPLSFIHTGYLNRTKEINLSSFAFKAVLSTEASFPRGKGYKAFKSWRMGAVGKIRKFKGELKSTTTMHDLLLSLALGLPVIIMFGRAYQRDFPESDPHHIVASYLEHFSAVTKQISR